MTGGRDDTFSQLERRVGHDFADRNLLKRALTHSSAAGKRAGGSYQQLEFLGDRVLALAIADMLLAAFPKASEGELARRLTALVRNETCVAVARELELGDATQLGGGEAQSGGRTKAAILGDVCEALIGALYLDGGVEPARQFIERHWRSRMLEGDAARPDAKTALQEWAQGRGLSTPAYAIVKRSGPEHAPRFTSDVRVEGLKPAAGEGGSRREAEQHAAAALLVREGIWKHEET
jgi:ribonuclease-3